jgi:S-adenosylmethionine:tRNA ribosyltransferase-isomerase
MNLDEWDYVLPPELIAKFPAAERDESRLMHVPVSTSGLDHRGFYELPTLLREGDLLVVNDSRVMAARLHARRASGGAVEILVLDPGPREVRALLRPARRLREGEVLTIAGRVSVRFDGREEGEEGVFRLTFDEDVDMVMAAYGEIPLPPYLERSADAQDSNRYQTVYAGPLGSAAAPTAGLHFTDRLLQRLHAMGVERASVTLHVGIGTFRPLRDEDVAAGKLHVEPYVIPRPTVEAVARTRARGGRVIAVGTTATRALEAASVDGVLRAGAGQTDILIQPGYRFQTIDGLITNFHLPRSSLLLLVAALVGRERLLDAYRTAVHQGYRFYSYGDAMLLL